jgi:putative transposase
LLSCGWGRGTAAIYHEAGRDPGYALALLTGNRTLVGGKPVSPPRLTLPELDEAIGRWITGTYHQRTHPETGLAPQAAWIADGWLPRTPDSLERLDLLLVQVARPRVVHRDGIHFQGLRYLAPTLAAYVGEPVTIRYDPRDLGEIRVFHRDRFVCRAIDTRPRRPGAHPR